MRILMKSMNIKKYAIFIMLMIASISLIGCSKAKEKETSKLKPAVHVTKAPVPMKFDEKEIVFSKADYFYSKDISVEILSKKPGKIYYSTDGSDPDKKQTLYKEAIRLIANQDTKANCIKARAYFDDGTESKTIVHTYFVGKNVEKRFDTLVFSVTSDPYNLYDYKHGILVAGKLRDDYVKKNPDVKINPDAPANYNMRGKDSEREVYLEAFEPNGKKIIGQEAGIRTYGAWSRASAQKSIKIFARKEYDKKNAKLRYEFFPDRTDVNRKVIDSYKKLVIRNSGNDNGFAFIRDEIFQTLAKQAGYQDYEAVRPAALFINGEYRGFYWLHEVYCDKYFEDHYGKYSGNFAMLEGGELFKKEDEDGGNKQYIADYQKMYNKYSAMDLTDDKNYKKLCDLIDVDNYLTYYALNIYLGNEDWPHNNYKTYRYFAADGEKYGKAPFDGKWRYLPHDMDFSTGIYGTGALVDNIQKYVGRDGEIMDTCPLFGQLMKRKDCREIFIKKTLDLINGAFAQGNFNRVLDTMDASRMNELSHSYNKGLMEDWVNAGQLQGKLSELKGYVYQRDGHILKKYKEYFGLKDTYKLTVKPPQGCRIMINTFETDQNFEGDYYSDYDTTVKLTCIPKDKKFDCWQVNGKTIQDKELVVTPSMITDGKVEIALMLK